MNYFPLIANLIERDPSQLEQAANTLSRWESGGVIPPGRAIQWRQILDDARSDSAGLAALLALLRDDSPEARRIKDFSPFAGLLTREQRRTVFLSCSYDH
jgi:hypothetical protein